MSFSVRPFLYSQGFVVPTRKICQFISIFGLICPFYGDGEMSTLTYKTFRNSALTKEKGVIGAVETNILA